MAQVDVKKIADKLIDAIKKDPKLITSFTKDPVKAVEKVTGIDLPDEKINALIKEVKTKLSKDKDGKIDIDKITKGLELLNSLTGDSKTTGKKTSKKDIDIEDIAKGVKTISNLLKK